MVIQIRGNKRKFSLGIIISLLFLSMFASFGFVSADEVVGTYSGVTDATNDHWAYYFVGVDSAWSTSGTEATNASYALIVTDDDTDKWLYQTTSSYKYPYQRFHYNVSYVATTEGFTISDISNIEVKHNGYGYDLSDASHNIFFAVYNDDLGTWQTSDSGGITGTWTHTSASDSNLLCDIPEANVTTFLSSDGILKFAVKGEQQSGASYTNIYTDYVEIKITYTPSLTAPTLVSPTSGGTGYGTVIDFDWNVSTGGTSPYTYEIMVADNLSFTTPDVNVTGLSDSNYSYTTGLTPGTTYYWKVRTLDAGSTYSSWTTTQSFTTASITAPTLVSPASATYITDTTPTVTWGVSTGGSGTYTYEIMIDNDVAFGSPEVNVTGQSGTSYTVTTALPLGTYYIKLRAKDSLNNYSAYSSASTFILTTESSGGASGGTTTPYTATQETPTVDNDTTTVTAPSSGSSTNVFTKYIINPVKTVVINPMKNFFVWVWESLMSLIRGSSQEELIPEEAKENFNDARSDVEQAYKHVMEKLEELKTIIKGIAEDIKGSDIFRRLVNGSG